MAAAAAGVGGSTNMIGGGGAVPTKAGPSGVESLPKEMNEMKLRDDKAAQQDDKVGGFGSVADRSRVLGWWVGA